MAARVLGSRCLHIGALLLLGADPHGLAAEALPHIRVAADGRHLETERGRPFVPFGVSYYRPGQGWAPQLWKKFDPEATRKDFAIMKELGVNCVRVFLTFGSFMTESNHVSAEGLAKFDQFLRIAGEAGIYVHPTGPDHWEGTPDWAKTDRMADETVLKAVEVFWHEFAARYRGHPGIYAYDLLNEPEVGWDSPAMRGKWNRWLEEKYGSAGQVAAAWNVTNQKAALGAVPVPPGKDCLDCPQLLDYQQFREEVADEWTRRQAAAIREADPRAMITIGMIQWSVPAVLPDTSHYAAFRPSRQAKYLDFLTIHFYPLATGHYDYRDSMEEGKNLAYLQSVVSEMAACGKPVVIGEFGWYGGGKVSYGEHPFASEAQQARWCSNVVSSTAGLACGWLNWGLYDQPEAGDVSQLTGLLNSKGEIKAWGREFKKLADRYHARRVPPLKSSPRPAMDWDACITSSASRAEFMETYFKAWESGRKN